MATVMDLLAAYPAICAECLTRRSQSRADAVLHQLDKLGIAPKEGHCAACAEVTPVYSAVARR